ncbi:hypothetical protein J7L49_02080 [Candidatus Bathyarchaeota archaeon]|nr:hypothetical protein [Candidatus Bathyarchaeota archaeon]
MSSTKIPIAYVELQVFVHATEDTDKVLTAAKNLFPKSFTDKITFKKVQLQGHHGNPIVLLKTKIKNKNVIEALFERISSSLNSLDKELLSRKITQHINHGNLYMRLDKQAAYLNTVKLCSADPIHLKIHFRKHSPEEIIEICKKHGMF